MTPYYEQDNITLYHGDCRDVLASLPPVSIDAMVSDPPYGTKVERDGYGRRQIHHGQQHIAGDEDLTVMADSLAAMQRILKPRSWVAVFCSPKRHAEAASLCQAHGFPVAGEAVWDKMRPGLGGGIRYQHESILLCHRGDAQGRNAMFSVLRGMADEQTGHPHEKPVDVMAGLVRYTTEPGQTVIDPFAGSGSTLVAAKLMGRKAIGIEVKEQWCEVIAARLSQGVLFGATA